MKSRAVHTPHTGNHHAPASVNRSHTVRRLLAAAALGVAACPVLAQPTAPPAPGPGATPAPSRVPATPPELEPFEGRLVRAITFETPAKAGGQPGRLESSLEGKARNQIRLHEGSPFSTALVSGDISRLNRTGNFKSVESRVQPLADQSVQLIYTVDPQPLITAVNSVGNRLFTDQEIAGSIGSIDTLVGTPVDPTNLARAARGIEARYREKGYYNTLVTIDEKELGETGIVLFRVREGERTRVTSVRFTGNLNFSARELRGPIKTQEAWLLKRGPVDNEQLDSDVAALIAYYKDRGYLDVRADYIITPSADAKEAIVTFEVEEGPVYTLRDMKLSVPQDDQPVFSTAQLLGLMSIHPGDVYSDKKLKESLEAIKDAYGTVGYTDIDVQRRELKVPDESKVDIVIVIPRQGRRFKAGEMPIQGNSITRDDVIRKFLTFSPDRPLDTTAVRESEKRLKQSGLFNPAGVKLTIQPETAEDPGYRDVLVQIEETNTGKFAIGASVGSDSGVVGQITITQRNFDITDFPDSFGELFRGDAFRGGGQTFTIEALPGDRSKTLAVSLSDPHVLESDYSAGASVYYRDRDYTSYTEQRVGTTLSVGEHFGSRWTASIPFRLEQVSLPSIDPTAPNEYFDVKDSRIVNSIGLSFHRSSTDSVVFPTKGNSIGFGITQVGLLGDFTFTGLHADYATYLKLSEDVLGRATTLALNTSAGYIPQGQGSVPFYERYYLGGENFRGFAYRAVSPVGIRHDNGLLGDDPIGGTFTFFAGAEVRHPLYEDLLSGVLFVDTGTVDTKPSFDKYRVSVGFGFRIYVAQLSPVPLAFDFGFPIIKEPTDRKRLFTFSVAVPFR